MPLPTYNYSYAQVTVNNQIVIGTLMNICDNPNVVSVGQDWGSVSRIRRTPIIVTGGLRGACMCISVEVGCVLEWGSVSRICRTPIIVTGEQGWSGRPAGWGGVGWGGAGWGIGAYAARLRVVRGVGLVWAGCRVGQGTVGKAGCRGRQVGCMGTGAQVQVHRYR